MKVVIHKGLADAQLAHDLRQRGVGVTLGREQALGHLEDALAFFVRAGRDGFLPVGAGAGNGMWSWFDCRLCSTDSRIILPAGIYCKPTSPGTNPEGDTMETANPRSDQPLHDYLRLHARRKPGKAAYLWYGHAVSYSELDRASDAFAARLAQLGVKKGDPVALF